MIHVLVRLQVEDYNQFKSAFEDALGWRRERGEKSFDLYRREHDSNDLTILFGWDEIGVARDVFASTEWRRRMDDAGVVGEPRVTFLQLLDRGQA
ncbi:MAG: hypothetical protein KY397_02475 [Gemmatimonadetes bacterium]|nr:hypothetical protein [Gemmatimonadota bacterium]